MKIDAKTNFIWFLLVGLCLLLALPAQADNKWKVEIKSGADPLIIFGTHPDSTEGFDETAELTAEGYSDMYAPPPWGSLQAAFEIPGKRLYRDIRPLVGSASWSLKIYSESQFSISWDVSAVPENVELKLDDIDMRQQLSKDDIPAGTHSMTITASVPQSVPTKLEKVKGDGTFPAGSSVDLVVRVLDQFGEAMNEETVAFEKTEGNGTLSANSDPTGSDGQASVTLTLATTDDENHVIAKVDSLTVEFIVIGVAPATVVVESSANNLVANGTSTANITVTVKDSQGNPVVGETITLTLTPPIGSISTPVDNGDGTYSATYTAGTTAGVVTITATTANGKVGSVNVTLTAGPPATVTVASSVTSLVANGISTANITVTVKDATGNPVAGEALTLTRTPAVGSISAPVDNKNGTYSAIYTAGTTAGVVTITATTANGKAGNVNITLTGPPETVTVASSVPSLVANGISTANITVTVKDANGNPVAGEALTLALTPSVGSISTPIDNGNGTYSATYTAGTTVGVVVTITATASNGKAGSVNITLTPGPPETVTVASSAPSLVANGTSTANITITVKDANDNPVVGETVTLTASLGSIILPVVDNGDGTYNATYKSSTTAGVATIIATTSNGKSGSVNITLTPGPPETVTVSSSLFSLCADGTSTITVTLKDANNNPVAGETVTLTASLGSISVPTDNGNGTYSATYTAGTTAGVATITATTANGKAGSVNITLIACVAETVTVASSVTSLVANGTSTANITVTVKDANNNPVVGETVTLTASLGSIILPVVDNGNGTYSATYTAGTTAGVATITATTANGKAGSVNVTLTAGSPETVTVASSATSLVANGTSTANITVTVKDANNNPVAGETVTLTASLGSIILPVVDNGNGTYSATYTAGTTAGVATITATTANGKSGSVQVTLTGVPTLPVGPPPNDPPKINKIGGKDPVPPPTFDAVAGTQLELDIKATDPNGDTITYGAFSKPKGASLDPATGVFTWTPTSDQVGTYPIQFTASDPTGDYDSATVEINVIKPVEPASITVIASPISLPADGISTSVITATVTGSDGKTFKTDTVTMTIAPAGNGQITAVTNKGDGTYTATYTAGTTAGTVTVTATTSNGKTGTVNITLNPVPASVTVIASSTSLPADGKATSTITATVKDANGSLVKTDTVTMTITPAGNGQITAVTNKGDGTYTATYTAGATAGTVTVTATTSNGKTGTVNITLNPVPASVTVIASPTSLPADGKATSTITATVKDANGSLVKTDTVTMTIAPAGNGQITAVTNKGDGTYTATYTAGTTAGTVTVTATTSNGKTGTVNITLIAPASLDVSASLISLPADGTSTSVITASVTGTDGKSFKTDTVTMTITPAGNGQITTVTNKGDGTYTATYTAGATAGTVTITAKTSNNISDKVDITLKPSFVEFTLSLSKGINMLSVPLDTTAVETPIKKVSDLVAVLGKDDVSLIISYNVETQKFQSFIPGSTPYDAPTNVNIGPSTGLIVSMKNPKEITFRGNGWQPGAVELNKGINLISIPLNDPALTRVSDLAKVLGDKVSLIISYNTVQGKFQSFTSTTAAGTPADVPIEGGKSLIVSMKDAGSFKVAGEPWETQPQLAPLREQVLMLDQTISPILELNGAVAVNGLSVTARNLSSGAVMTDTTGLTAGDGRFSITFVDFVTNQSAKVGDVLEVSFSDPNGKFGVDSIRYTVNESDIQLGRIALGDLVAYPIPSHTELLQNWPNPFNPETWIPFKLKEASDVAITIYDINGRTVRTLELGQVPAGIYQTKSKAAYWDGTNDVGEHVASGIYFYRLQTDNFSALRKMAILK